MERVTRRSKRDSGTLQKDGGQACRNDTHTKASDSRILRLSEYAGTERIRGAE